LNHTGKSMRRPLIWISLAAVVIAAAAVVAATSTEEGSGDPGSANPRSSEVDFREALAGAPPALARLYANGDELIAGGADELHSRIDALRGHPVVVNVWASWCGPCRSEFPDFQRVAARMGDEVAFIGVDSADSEDAARTFLDELPLPYPSVTDPDEEVKRELDLVGYPGTAFFDADGERVYVKQGPYTSADELRADVERYAG
jgi:cytochrome c biogenesis protein CcmG, thiol:disulfide interchange protein DsbE